MFWAIKRIPVGRSIEALSGALGVKDVNIALPEARLSSRAAVFAA